MIGETEEVRDSTNPENDYRFTNVENDVMCNPIEGIKNIDALLENKKEKNLDSNVKSYKIVILGDKGVGKTSLIKRFVTNKFSEEGSNKDTEKYNKIAQTENGPVNLEINDPCIISKMGKYPKEYFKDAYGAIIVFDLTNKESFENIKYWLSELDSNATIDIVIYALGNKSDDTAERKVSKAEEEEFFKNKAKKVYKYYDVSAKNGNNISLSFEGLLQDILEKQLAEENNPDKVERGEGQRKTKHLMTDEELEKTNNNEAKPKGRKCC